MSLDSDIDRAIKTIEERAGAAQKKIAFQAFDVLVKTTPVDTGRARNGWIMSAGSPSTKVPPKGEASYPAPQARLGRVRFGEPIWIVNNVEYIVYLDEGSSQQAPGGMTALALAQVEAQFG